MYSGPLRLSFPLWIIVIATEVSSTFLDIPQHTLSTSKNATYRQLSVLTAGASSSHFIRNVKDFSLFNAHSEPTSAEAIIFARPRLVTFIMDIITFFYYFFFNTGGSRWKLSFLCVSDWIYGEVLKGCYNRYEKLLLKVYEIPVCSIKRKQMT